MKIKISVPEIVNLIKGLKENPSSIFEMATMNVQKDVGNYLTNLMNGKKGFKENPCCLQNLDEMISVMPK